MEEEIIAPVELGFLHHPETAAVAFVRGGGVSVALLLLQREVEELPPRLLHAAHQLLLNSMVDHLEESPLAASAGDELQSLPAERLIAGAQVVEVNRGDVDLVHRRRVAGEQRAVREVFDVAVGDGPDAALREGLNSDNGLGPGLYATHDVNLLVDEWCGKE